MLIGVVANTLFRSIRSATLAATIGAPVVVYFCLWVHDPDGTWSCAALLVAPLVHCYGAGHGSAVVWALARPKAKLLERRVTSPPTQERDWQASSLDYVRRHCGICG